MLHLYLEGPVLMLVMFIVKRYRYIPSEGLTDQTKSNEEDESKLFDRHREIRLLVIVLFSTLVAVFNVYESMIYTFAVTYFQYGPLKLDAPTAAEVITGFTVSYAACRALACFVAVKVQPKFILSFCLVISAIGVVLLAATKTITMLWIANVVLGVGCSAVMQTLYAFVGQNLRMTDMISTILVVFFGTFNIAPPYVLGLFIKDYSYVFLVVEVGTLSTCMALFVVLLIVIRKYEGLDQNKLKGLCN